MLTGYGLKRPVGHTLAPGGVTQKTEDCMRKTVRRVRRAEPNSQPFDEPGAFARFRGYYRQAMG